MRYASLFDGIGTVHLAWQGLGWECAWTSEIDPFAIRVVEHHYRVKNLGDVRNITKEMCDREGPLDVMVGGSPCVSFSSLGNRKGLDDPRGQLALRFLELAADAKPRWIVFENVPRIKSSAKGRDFGTFLRTLEELGYGWAYRTLDTRYFGLAQSRERMFLVGYRGDWRRAAAVLFERDTIFGPSSPREEGREDTAGTAGAHFAGGVATLGGRQRLCYGFHANARACEIACRTRDLRLSAALTVSQRAAVAYEVPGASMLGIHDSSQLTSGEVHPNPWQENGFCNPVRVNHPVHGVTWWIVRSMNPVECERVQGFWDGYTQVPDHQGKPAAKTLRYKALGNAMPVPVMRWIGWRIQTVDAMDESEQG